MIPKIYLNQAHKFSLDFYLFFNLRPQLAQNHFLTWIFNLYCQHHIFHWLTSWWNILWKHLTLSYFSELIWLKLHKNKNWGKIETKIWQNLIHMIKLYFKNHLKNADTQTRCNMGKSTKNPAGFYTTDGHFNKELFWASSFKSLLP